MIPILYPGNETQFNKNGLGPLADAISCVVEEERNGQYELHMTYPVTGVHYADLQETRIILAKPFDGGTAQPFIIYKISRPMDGIVTVDAEHISYRLNGTVVMPFSSSGIISLFSTDLPGHIVGTSPFTFQTDITSADGYSVDLPREVRGVLGGEQDSILQKYGGEWEFNRFNCYLHAARGSDNNVTLRYGKNITDINSVIDMTSVYTGIVPYWTNENETVTLTEKVVMSSHASDYPFNIVKTVDFSSDFETAPTETQLRNAATAYVNNNEGWKLKNNIEVSFVALWETEQYKNIAPLERVKLCDLVTVIYEPLGVNFKTKVIATEYNVLTEKYNKITLGEQSFTLGAIIEESVTESEVQTTSRMRNAIERATKLIQGGLGGHVVFSTNADGEPEEILIMDTDDIGTATNVIRMNLAGIGFSDSGYMGPFDTAWTIDGHFVADYIDTGTLNADLIKAGILQDAGGNTTFNLATGALTSKNLTIDSTYFKLSNTGKITSITSDNKKLVMESGKITGYKADGTESAALEIGDGYFNIVGKLALNGNVGVSGTNEYIKGINYTSQQLVTSLTTTGVLSTGNFVSSVSQFNGIVTTDTLYYMNQYGTASYTTIVVGVTFPTYTFNQSAAVTGVPSYTANASMFDIPNFLSGIIKGTITSKYGLVTEIS